MKKRSLMLGCLLAVCFLVGCQSVKEESKENPKEQQEGIAKENEVDGPEPEGKEEVVDVTWVQDSIDNYVKTRVHGYTQEIKRVDQEGNTTSEIYNATIDLDKGLVYMEVDFGDGSPIKELFEKQEDGTVYYYTQDYTTKEMVRSASNEETFQRAISLTNNIVNLENQTVEILGDCDFEGKKATEVLVKSNNPEYTIYATIANSISEEKVNSDANYKDMVEKSKTSLQEYRLYFDSASKDLIGLKIDRTISDFFNFYDMKSLKSSNTTAKYLVGDSCTKIEIPEEYKES